MPLGGAGGFSGASIWRGESAGEPLFCLKAWPHGYPSERLFTVHRWMRLARDRTSNGVVPAVVPCTHGDTAVTHGGRVWDVTAWMPGTADFARRPSDAKLAAACAALAVLHRAWAVDGIDLAPCPGVQRRLEVLSRFASRPTVPEHPDPQLRDLIRRAIAELAVRLPKVISKLREVAGRAMPVFPCLCDVWHDHVLFLGDRVTGIIDYGAMKVDHPSVDLARLLGDLVGSDRAKWATGLTAYRDADGPVDIDGEFAEILDRSGVIGGVIHWLRRLAGDGPAVSDLAAARARLHALVERVCGL